MQEVTKQIRTLVGAILILAASAGLNQALAGGKTCVRDAGNNVEVCVEWSRGGNPQHGQDFIVDFTPDPTIADVELATGDLEWIVYAIVVATGQPSTMGSITTTDSDNYIVKIANGSGAGAATVINLTLTPPGDNYSSLAAGSIISRTINGNISLQSDSGGNGGALNLSVGSGLDTHGIAGTISVPVVQKLVVNGGAYGDVTVGKIEGGDKKIDIRNLGANVDISITDSMAVSAQLRVARAVGGTNQITVGTVNSTALIELGYDTSTNYDVDGDVTMDELDGDVMIHASLGSDLNVIGDVSSTGSITLGRHLRDTARILVSSVCDGTIEIEKSTKSGSLIRLTGGLDDNGNIRINTDEEDHDAAGDIHIGPADDTSTDPVVFDGYIRVFDEAGSGDDGDLDGDITVNGCHATSADLNICIDGSVNGQIQIHQTGCTNQVTHSCTP